MLKDLLKAGGKTIKYIFGAGFIGALLLISALRGCTLDTETNKYDAKSIETVTKGNIELKKTLDVTAIEEKKLDMQDKTILDVNKSEQMKMEYEIKKLELIEAQKLQNELKLAEMQIELEKSRNERERAESSAKAQDAAKKKAQAKAAEEKAKQSEVDIYKAILNN